MEAHLRLRGVVVLDKLFHLLGEAAASALQQSEHLLQARGRRCRRRQRLPISRGRHSSGVRLSHSGVVPCRPVAVALECVLRFNSTSHHRLLQKMRNPSTEDTELTPHGDLEIGASIQVPGAIAQPRRLSLSPQRSDRHLS